MPANEVTFGINRRDDTKFFVDGTVPLRGFQLTFPERPKSWNYFTDMVTDTPWDIAELALSHYLIAKDLGKPLTAIPAFPVRVFPHLGVSVYRPAGIHTPEDLVGKTVGAPDWGYHPAVWMRGILTHQYDVPIERIIWAESDARPLFPGLDYHHSPRFQFAEMHPPADLGRSQRATYGMPELLESGAVDAMFFPGPGRAPTANTEKLFADPAAEIKAYVQQVGAIPINSVIVLKQDTVDRYPDLAPAVMEMMSAALPLWIAEQESNGQGRHLGVPAALVRELGQYPLGYGLAASNREAMRLMIAYCYEQGLIKTLYEPEELFVASCR